MARTLIPGPRSAAGSRSAPAARRYMGGRSLRFSSSSDRFVTASAIPFTPTMTFATWINRQSVGFGGVPRIFDISGNANAALALGNAGAGGVTAGSLAFGAWKNTSIILNINQWYHVVALCNAGAVQIYLNGRLVYTDTNTAIGTGTGILRIGNVGGEGLDAYLKDAMVWNAVLTPDQINKLFHANIVPASPNVIFRMNETSGSSASDSSGNSNNGTITGGSHSTTVPFPERSVFA